MTINIDNIKLAVHLAKTRFHLQNEGSYLGFLWYILTPMLFFLTFLLIRGSVDSVGIIDNYPLYLILGIILVQFFIVTTSSAILFTRKNSVFIKSINVSPNILITADILKTSYIHLLFEFPLIILVMIFSGVPLIGIVLYPIIFAVFAFFVFGISLIFAVLGTYIYDLGNVWRALSRLLFLATPIFYVTVPGTLHHSINLFNPLFYFIELTRHNLLYNSFPPPLYILIPILITIVTFIGGLSLFNKFKKKFTEKI